MEKLICSACGAPLTVTTSEPFLKCEYCDTAIENKYYVEPEPVVPQPAEEEAEVPQAEEPASSGGSLLKTILGVGTAIAASKMRRRSAVLRQPAVRVTPMGRRAAVAHPPRPAVPAAPRRPQPPRPGGTGMHMSRPSMTRHAGGPGGRGPGMRRGPGGRHR